MPAEINRRAVTPGLTSPVNQSIKQQPSTLVPYPVPDALLQIVPFKNLTVRPLPDSMTKPTDRSFNSHDISMQQDSIITSTVGDSLQYSSIHISPEMRS